MVQRTLVPLQQANAMFAMMPAFPQSIEFTAKEGEEEWEILRRRLIFQKAQQCNRPKGSYKIYNKEIKR